MSSEEPFDTRFSLPAIDDPASTEVGVMLMGLDTERLLAGLGVAALADDPAMVTLLVDQVRHGATIGMSMRTVVAAGARRWRSVRPALEAAGRTGAMSGAVRRMWQLALAAVNDAEVGDLGPASRAYLAACWLRGSEVDRHLAAGHVEVRHAVPEVAP